MTTALKPCPFCGGGGEVQDVLLPEDGTIPSRWEVACGGCDSTGPIGFTREEAANLWNTRHTAEVASAVSGHGAIGFPLKLIDYDARGAIIKNSNRRNSEGGK